MRVTLHLGDCVQWAREYSVVGVELTDEYLPIARARVKHWETRQLELTA